MAASRAVRMRWPEGLFERASAAAGEGGVTQWVVGLVTEELGGRLSSPGSSKPSSPAQQEKPLMTETIQQPVHPPQSVIDPWVEPPKHKFEPKFGAPNECKHCSRGRRDREQH